MNHSFAHIRILMHLLVCASIFSGCGDNPKSPRPLSESEIPAGMFVVTPLEESSRNTETKTEAPEARLEVKRARFFSYVLPEGWKLQEDGQFALTMVAPDQKALTIMVGNSGLFPDYPPGRFVYDKLMALQPQNLQIADGQTCAPIKGFQYAFAFPVSYSIGGVPCRGLVKCHIAPYYGGATMAITGALSEAKQWAGYSSWLPLVADQVAAVDGAAFGMRGVMQQNIETSTAYAEAAREYRDWSQRNWQAVTDHRNATQDRQQRDFRENLGAVQTWHNPYDNQRPLELTTQYSYYWVDRQGHVLGTNDPGVNPNQGSTGDWQMMQKRQ